MKGQTTIIGLMFCLIMIIMTAAFMPTIYNVCMSISGNATANGDATTATIAGLFPTVLMLSVLMTPVIYVLAGRSQREEG